MSPQGGRTEVKAPAGVSVRTAAAAGDSIAQHVSAPVSIDVFESGAGQVDVGNAVYDMSRQGDSWVAEPLEGPAKGRFAASTVANLARKLADAHGVSGAVSIQDERGKGRSLTQRFEHTAKAAPAGPKRGSLEAKIAAKQTEVERRTGAVSLAREARSNTGSRIQSGRESKANAALSRATAELNALKRERDGQSGQTSPAVGPDLSDPAVARAQRLLDQVKTGKSIYFRAGDQWMIMGPSANVEPGRRLTVHKADGSTTEVIVGEIKSNRTVQGVTARTATFRKAPPPAVTSTGAVAERSPATSARPTGPVDETALRERYSRAADRVAQLDGDNLNGRQEQAAQRELAAARQALLDAGLPLRPTPERAPRSEPFNPARANGGNLPPKREGETDGMYNIRVAPTDDAAEKQLRGYSIAGLKAILREAGLPTGGTKEQLIERAMGPRRRYWDSIGIERRSG